MVLRRALLPALLALGAASSELYARDATGDRKCSSYMCVGVVVNGTTTTYTLSGTGQGTPGWMGMGFGSTMSNTPMVIMWSNPDGSITMSQRRARGEVMPTVDSAPPRVATVQTSLSTTGTSPSFVFTVDSTDAATQPIIYAYGTQNPGSTAEDASFAQHLDRGATSLNLQRSLTSTNSTGSGSGSSGDTGDAEDTGGVTDDIPLTPYQRMIIAHAIFCVLGFALFLPIGALVARFLRTFSPGWYTAHWIAQFIFAGVSILAGVVLGFKAASYDGSISYTILDEHKKIGIVLFVLYLAQCALGAIIHWVKPKRVLRRPPQNYLHAIFGLTIIALALYQIRTGIKTEWLYTGLGALPDGVYTLWIVWCVVLPVMYAVGLVFLRKQYMQEAAFRRNKGWTDENANAGDEYGMSVQLQPGMRMGKREQPSEYEEYQYRDHH
ncbi:CBD9-like protein [Mycena kentingensis (nom. inval.)]|nr:CBD9-like protein [Mycena kentingensis (nom. inval.)]